MRGQSDDIASSDRRVDVRIEARRATNFEGHTAAVDDKDWV